MTHIWERLYLGNFKDAEELATSNPAGVTAVISLCEDPVRYAIKVNYAHIPIADSRPILDHKFQEIMSAIQESIRCGRLLVHCMGGSSRSPIMVAAWLHRCGYSGIDRALAEIAELRDIQPSPILLKSVKEHLTHGDGVVTRTNGRCR
jgi:protein-tyrosine phosphatase